jgi:hypothetical protein
MSQLKSLTVLALAAAGLLAAGCSSSSSSSSSVPAATSPAASAASGTTSTAAPTLPPSPTASTPPVAAGPPSAADCKIIKPISASAISKLTPLSSEPKAKAIAGMNAYIATLTTAEATLTPGGKKVIGDFITSLKKSQTESTSKATTVMIAALGSLGKACT